MAREAALAADLHARLDDSANVPQAWRSRLHDFTDRAVGFFAREVADRTDNEGDGAARATSLPLIMSRAPWRWLGKAGRIHEMRGDAREAAAVADGDRSSCFRA